MFFKTHPLESAHRPATGLGSVFLCLSMGWMLLFVSNGSCQAHGMRTDGFIALPRESSDPKELNYWHESKGCEVVRRLAEDGTCLIKIPANKGVFEMIREYELSALFEFVEPDYRLRANLIPNDPAFRDGRKWEFRNLGTGIGRPDADIDAIEAWETTKDASSVIVAIVDTGIRYTHEDLADNMWRNPGEIPENGIDDDRNGIVDDVFGFNAVEFDGDPYDVEGHGTHVAGIVGAVGNNRLGTVGVAWSVQLMGLRFLSDEGEGFTSSAIACIDYARLKGADIINASWGGGPRSRGLERAIRRAGSDGILFVTAAGNEGQDLEISPVYPPGYEAANIIVVAASDERDRFLTSSNWGQTLVDIAAPGRSIYSCWGTGDRNYQTASGTSMAAPCVAGALALMKALNPDAPYWELKDQLLGSVDPIAGMSGRLVSGGRLNLDRALRRIRPMSIEPVTLEFGFVTTTQMFLLSLTGDANREYLIQVKNRLSESWTELLRLQTSSRGVASHLVSTDDVEARFFRVVVEP